MKEKEKDFIEPEIIKDESKTFTSKTEDKFNIANNQIKAVKNMILLQGIKVIILPILVFILVTSILIGIIFLIFDTPFDWIVSGVLLFFIGKFVYKIISLFR